MALHNYMLQLSSHAVLVEILAFLSYMRLAAKFVCARLIPGTCIHTCMHLYGGFWCECAAMRQLLFFLLQGVLYVDAQSGYKFSTVLAQAAGINLTPLPNLIESFRHHTSIFHREPIHFILPNGSASDQINYVFDNIRHASAYYHKIYNSRPTL